LALKLSLRDLYYRKILLTRELENKLPLDAALKVGGDYHARKPPRPCGATVHSVVGCAYRCTYCYLPDMGVSNSVYNTYALSGEEMTYALLSNPSFLPGRLGTLIAIGSLGEPFVDDSAFHRTLEHLQAFSRYLGNPTQFSTKSALKETQVRALAAVKLPLSPLVTLVTLTKSERLEPGAPSPEARLETIKMMRKNGLHPVVFLRPLIPGVNSEEVDDILAASKAHGAVGVVIGGFRVTPLILDRLEKAGFDTSEIRRRVKAELKQGKQLPVELHDVKREALAIAREKGLVPFLSACCANNYTAMLHDGLRAPCPGLDYIDGRFCTLCPVNCPSIQTFVDESEVKEFVEKLTSVKVLELRLDEKFIYLRLAGKKRISPHVRAVLEVGYRRKVVMR